MAEYKTYREPDTAIDEFFLDDRSIQIDKYRVRKKLGMTTKKVFVEKPSVYASLKLKLYRAGFDKEAVDVLVVLLHISLIITGIGMIVLGVLGMINGFPWYYIVGGLVVWILVGFIGIYPLLKILFEVYLNYRVFKRRLEVETVLPEFLRLVANNYRSGLSLDKALEKSNRARFGIFSKEIELMAKSASIKGNLGKSLEIFGKKFDSKILERSMNSIAMSVRSGSNISPLLEEIATNIMNMRNIRASMAANVKNYTIFIIVAAIFIAPLMFGMSFTMNSMITQVIGLMPADATSQMHGGLGATISLSPESGVDIDGFNAFAHLMLITNSIICAFVISIIMNGNFQQGIKNIPMYLIISLGLFYLGKYAFSFLIAMV